MDKKFYWQFSTSTFITSNVVKNNGFQNITWLYIFVEVGVINIIFESDQSSTKIYNWTPFEWGPMFTAPDG